MSSPRNEFKSNAGDDSKTSSAKARPSAPLVPGPSSSGTTPLPPTKDACDNDDSAEKSISPDITSSKSGTIKKLSTLSRLGNFCLKALSFSRKLQFHDALSVQAESCEMDLDLALEESRLAIYYFFNNKFDEAHSLLKPLAHVSMYHAVGHTVFSFFEAILTFEQHHIATAMEDLKKCLEVCNRYKRKNTITESIGKKFKKANYEHYTDLEAHAELCSAEALLLKAMLTFIEDETLSSLIKGGIKIRHCFNSYKECNAILSQRKWTSSSSKLHFESGVRMGMGTFNLMISLLPSCIIKILEFIGFSGDKAYSSPRPVTILPISYLCDILAFEESNEAKEFFPLYDLECVGEKLRLNKNAFEEPDVPYTLAKTPRKAGLDDLETGYKLPGLRQVLCAMTLLGYHLIVCYVLSHQEGDLDFCDQILTEQLQQYPEGVWFLFFKGRLEFMKGNLDKAQFWYKKSWKSQDIWPQFHHLNFWELLWVNCLKLDWRESTIYATYLLENSKWSKTIYSYQKAALLLMLDDLSTSEKETVDRLMREAPQYKQRIAGKSLPMEKFICKKAERYFAQNSSLVLPAIELMYVWNTFKVMGKHFNIAEKIYQLIQAKLKTIEGKAPTDPYYADNLGLVLLLKGACLRQTKNPYLALNVLESVIALQNKIKEDTYLVAYALVEIGLIYAEQGQRDQAIAALEDAKKKYSGYSLESRLQFRIHSALTEFKVDNE